MSIKSVVLVPWNRYKRASLATRAIIAGIVLFIVLAYVVIFVASLIYGSFLESS